MRLSAVRAGAVRAVHPAYERTPFLPFACAMQVRARGRGRTSGPHAGYGPARERGFLTGDGWPRAAQTNGAGLWAGAENGYCLAAARAAAAQKGARLFRGIGIFGVRSRTSYSRRIRSRARQPNLRSSNYGARPSTAHARPIRG
jgi:hypothetical protein